jgi:hypothetical protein
MDDRINENRGSDAVESDVKQLGHAMPETVQITNFEIIPFCRDFFQGWHFLARLPRVASPSFVKSTSEGRQPLYVVWI